MRDHPKISVSLLTSVMLASCVEQAWQEAMELAPSDTGTSSTSTGDPVTPTTSSSDNPGVQTVTSDGSTSAAGESSSTADQSSSTGGPAQAPPKIELFMADPPHLYEAGGSEIKLIASADVVVARLSLNGEKIFEGPPEKFPRSYEVLSAKYNFPHNFGVEVENAEGLKATDTAELTVLLPKSGTPKCLYQDAGAQASVIAALKYTRKAIYAVGSRDSGSGLELTVWALDPDHCEVVLPGWPKTLADWTDDEALGALASGGAAMSLDESGNLAIGGNLIIGGEKQPYVALLNPDGALLWEKTGSVGDELAGLDAFTDQFSNRLVGVGWRTTNKNPVFTDAMVWTYQAFGDSVTIASQTLKAPFFPDEKIDKFNIHSEWARAVLVKDGVAFIAGEREFEDGNLIIWNRAFLAKLYPLGEVEHLWTSWGVHSVHDAARSLALCGKHLVAGGWDRDKPLDAKPEPLILWFNTDGTFAQARPDALPWTQTNGIACDREDKIISGGVRLAGEDDAQVFTVSAPEDPRTWYEQGVVGVDAVGAVACDSRGFCAGGGLRTANGVPFAFVRVFHP